MNPRILQDKLALKAAGWVWKSRAGTSGWKTRGWWKNGVCAGNMTEAFKFERQWAEENKSK